METVMARSVLGVLVGTAMHAKHLIQLRLPSACQRPSLDSCIYLTDGCAPALEV